MKPHLLYLIGVPGSGKTTLARQLVLGRRRRVIPAPFAHTVYEDGLVQLGRDRDTHGGTDALSMSVQPKVVAALQARAWTRVLGEGDRLANGAFFAAVKAAGYELDVVLVDVPPEVAAERRARRGTDQDPTWLRGRESKVARLCELGNVARIDGTRPVEELAAFLGQHPALLPPQAASAADDTMTANTTTKEKDN